MHICMQCKHNEFFVQCTYSSFCKDYFIIYIYGTYVLPLVLFIQFSVYTFTVQPRQRMLSDFAKPRPVHVHTCMCTLSDAGWILLQEIPNWQETEETNYIRRRREGERVRRTSESTEQREERLRIRRAAHTAEERVLHHTNITELRAPPQRRAFTYIYQAEARVQNSMHSIAHSRACAIKSGLMQWCHTT